MKLIRMCRPVGLFLVVCVVLLFMFRAEAQQADALSTMEQQFFARDYMQDTLESRVSRLEYFLLGATQEGDVHQRERHLEQIYQSNVAKTVPASPASSPDAKGSTASPTDASTATPPAQDLKNTDGTDYPAVSKMEEKVFHQTYAQEDVSHRLLRLEQSVFKQTYPNLAMVDRVDQLALKLNPNGPLSVEEGINNQQLPSDADTMLPGGVAIYSQLNTLEQQFLGTTYGGELIARRVARLETRVFGAPRPGKIADRMDNLIKQSYRMQSQSENEGPPPFVNNGAPFVAPGPQRPGYAPPPQSAYYGTNAYPPTNSMQNIMQSVTMLENQVFNRTFSDNPLLMRLNNLEQHVLGTVFPQDSPAQRVNRLLSKVQFQQGTAYPNVSQPYLSQAASR